VRLFPEKIRKYLKLIQNQLGRTSLPSNNSLIWNNQEPTPNLDFKISQIMTSPSRKKEELPSKYKKWIFIIK